MKKLIVLTVLGVSMAAMSAVYAGPQQEKMKACSKEAKGKALKGGERKAFMKGCLSKKTDASAGAASVMPADTATGAAAISKKEARQDKMKNCNKEAGDKMLKGDERKKFMSGCLKG